MRPNETNPTGEGMKPPWATKPKTRSDLNGTEEPNEELQETRWTKIQDDNLKLSWKKNQIRTKEEQTRQRFELSK
jgi:hypothetical protein